MKLWNRLRRKRPSAVVGPVTVVPVGGPPRVTPVSLHDFTVTIDTRHSRSGEHGYHKLVLHLDREGEPTLHMQVDVQQFFWFLEDPDQFAQAYAARAHWVDPYNPPVDPVDAEQHPAVMV